MCESYQETILITPSDATLYDPPLKAISIGTAGILNIQDGQQNTVAIPANSLVIGVLHRFKIQRVMSTTTTAAELVGYR